MVVTLPGQTFSNGGNTGSVSTQTVGSPFNVAALTACDSYLNIQPDYTGSKTITWSGPGVPPNGSPNPGYTTAVTFAAGQATTTLATTLYDAQTITITATDGTLTGAASSSLTVNPGAINRIRMQAEPSSSVTVNSLFGTEPVVAIQDTWGNIETGDNSSVVSAGLQPGSGSLGGATTAAASAGVLRFSGLKAPTVAQSGMKLLFTDTPDGVAALNDNTSITVNAGAAAQLAFTTQPGVAAVNAVWPQQPAVALQDAYGNAKTGVAQNVTLAIENNAGGGALSGTLTQAVNTGTGVALFPSLSINQPGNGYTLTATGSTVDTSAGTIVSGGFNIVVSATLNYDVKFVTP
jgi:hypothetical protein